MNLKKEYILSASLAVALLATSTAHAMYSSFGDEEAAPSAARGFSSHSRRPATPPSPTPFLEEMDARLELLKVAEGEDIFGEATAEVRQIVADRETISAALVRLDALQDPSDPSQRRTIREAAETLLNWTMEATRAKYQPEIESLQEELQRFHADRSARLQKAQSTSRQPDAGDQEYYQHTQQRIEETIRKVQGLFSPDNVTKFREAYQKFRASHLETMEAREGASPELSKLCREEEEAWNAREQLGSLLGTDVKMAAMFVERACHDIWAKIPNMSREKIERFNRTFLSLKREMHDFVHFTANHDLPRIVEWAREFNTRMEAILAPRPPVVAAPVQPQPVVPAPVVGARVVEEPAPFQGAPFLAEEEEDVQGSGAHEAAHPLFQLFKELERNNFARYRRFARQLVNEIHKLGNPQTRRGIIATLDEDLRAQESLGLLNVVAKLEENLAADRRALAEKGGRDPMIEANIQGLTGWLNHFTTHQDVDLDNPHYFESVDALDPYTAASMLKMDAHFPDSMTTAQAYVRYLLGECYTQLSLEAQLAVNQKIFDENEKLNRQAQTSAARR